MVTNSSMFQALSEAKPVRGLDLELESMSAVRGHQLPGAKEIPLPGGLSSPLCAHTCLC